jgi:hypothetical protein
MFVRLVPKSAKEILDTYFYFYFADPLNPRESVYQLWLYRIRREKR